MGFGGNIMQGLAPITVYCLDNCPNCDTLKKFLKEKGLQFKEEDMACAGPLTDLRIHGIFIREAPVLRIGDTFFIHTELFKDGKVKVDTIIKQFPGDLQ